MPRRKAFDPQEVLARAMRLFWRQGYHATSMEELVEHMGINRYSLYTTFGSKHTLFLAALQHYRDTVIALLVRDLEEPDTSLEALRHFFAQRVDTAVTSRERWGCLACNTAMELIPHDPVVAAAIRTCFDRLTQAFRHVLERAQARGELGRHLDATCYAQYLTGVFLGFLVYAKSLGDRQALENYVQVALSGLK